MRKNVQGTHRLVWGLVCGLVLFALPALAGVTGIDREVIVDPRQVSEVADRVEITITPAFLLGTSHPAGSTIVSNTGVLHGALDLALTGVFTYVPDQDFWLHGTDRFTFTVQHPSGTTQIGVAMLVAQTPGYFDSALNFDGTLGEWSLEQYQGTATVASSKLTILGTVGGLQLAEANVNREDFSTSTRGLTQGGKVVGGGGSPPPQPPPPSSGFAESPEYYDSFILLRGIAAEGGKPFSLELRPRPEGDDLRLGKLSPAGSPETTPWYFLGVGPHRYEVTWWENSSAPTVMVWVDGRLVLTERVLGLNVERIELGVLSEHPVTGTGLQLDDITLHGWDYYGIITTRARLAVVESFEDGVANDLAGAGTTYMSTSNPLNGIRDLIVESWNSQSSSVSYQNPNNQSERSWGSRFRLRAENLVLTENAIVTIAEAYSFARGSAPFRVEMRRNSGNVYQLRTVVKLVNGTEQASAWGHFNATGCNVEVQFTTPPSPTFKTGTARLWVNGVLRSEQAFLDNYNLTTDGFRLGLIDPASGISGYARFDTLQTWALNY